MRSAGVEDAALLGKWWRDGDVMAHAGFPLGLKITNEQISEQIQRGSGTLIIEVEDSPIGEMSYCDIGEKTAQIGIKICKKDMQSKGYGLRFLRMLIGELFAQGFEKIILDTNVNNIAAQKTYEKLGFRKLRTNADVWKDQMGVLQSSIDYELTRENFD